MQMCPIKFSVGMFAGSYVTINAYCFYIAWLCYYRIFLIENTQMCGEYYKRKAKQQQRKENNDKMEQNVIEVNVSVSLYARAGDGRKG